MKLKHLIYFFVLLGLGGVSYLSFMLLGHGFSARAKPLWIEAVIAKNVRRLAIPSTEKELTNPIKLDDLSFAQTRDHFADHCATCHGNDGSGKTLINEGLYPPAPDMRSETQKLTDGEIFYIIKNGIRFTGMPGWGGSDEENWKLVAFIRALPNLTDEQLELMKEINNLEN